MKIRTFFGVPFIGIDIQPHGLYAAKIRKKRAGFLLEQVAYQPVPADLLAEGKIKDWNSLSEILALLVQDLRAKGMPAILTLASNLVRMQKLQVPAGLTTGAIEAEIQHRLAQDFPGMPDTLCVDYVENPSATLGDSDIHFVVTKQEYLSQLVNCVSAAGLAVKIVDIDICALRRIVHFAMPAPAGKTDVHGILYLQHELATFILGSNTEIVSQQHWKIDALDLLNAQFRQKLQMCLAMFPQLKINTLALCGARQYKDILLREQFAEISLYCPDPFSLFAKKAALDNNLLTEKAADFLIACGAAMREVPLW